MAARWMPKRLQDMVVEIRDACYLLLALRHTGTEVIIQADAIGNQLGVPAGTVKKQLDRIKKKHSLNIKVITTSGKLTKNPTLDFPEEMAAPAPAPTNPALAYAQKTEVSVKEPGKKTEVSAKEPGKDDGQVKKRGGSPSGEVPGGDGKKKKKAKMSGSVTTPGGTKGETKAAELAVPKADTLVKIKTEEGEDMHVEPGPKTVHFEDFIDNVDEEDGWETADE